MKSDWQLRPGKPGVYWASRGGVVSLVVCGMGDARWLRCVTTSNIWLVSHYDGFCGPLEKPAPMAVPRLRVVR